MAWGKFFGKKKEEGAAESASAPNEPQPLVEVEPEQKKGFGALLKAGLAKTRNAISAVLPFGKKLDEEVLEEIEATLIQADFGPTTAMALTDDLRSAYKDKEFLHDEIIPFVKQRLVERLGDQGDIRWAEQGPTVIIVAGVNGVGKTTSIAKLANRFKSDGKSVMLAAGDTFRAAAIEQLQIWSDRLGIEMIRGADGGDPAAVAFDAIQAATEQNVDVLIIDTAGRLHTQKNLMNQLGKIERVIQKKIPEAPHEVLQVLDATTGQNAIQQASEFKKVLSVTGLVLTKLDGTARGGVIFPILDSVGLPVKYIGVGEGIDHLQRFDPPSFVDALFE